MKQLKEELLGSQRGGAMTEIAPSVMKRIRKFFKKNCHYNQKLEITNHPGGIICLMVVENTEEKISQLIMECKGNNINKGRL